MAAGKSFTIDNILHGAPPPSAAVARQQIDTYSVAAFQELPQQLHDAIPSTYWMANPSAVFRPLWPIQTHPTAIWFQQQQQQQHLSSMPVDLSASAAAVQRHQAHPAALFGNGNWMPSMAAAGCWTTNGSPAELLAFSHLNGIYTLRPSSSLFSPRLEKSVS